MLEMKENTTQAEDKFSVVFGDGGKVMWWLEKRH
jgi:hypothetical protein